MVHLPALATLSTVAAALKFSDRLALSVYGFPDCVPGFPAYYSLIVFWSRSSESQE
jgi:hypothetical protein